MPKPMTPTNYHTNYEFKKFSKKGAFIIYLLKAKTHLRKDNKKQQIGAYTHTIIDFTYKVCYWLSAFIYNLALLSLSGNFLKRQ